MEKVNAIGRRKAAVARVYLTEGWKRLRALGRPGFLRSTSRASRVMKPSLRRRRKAAVARVYLTEGTGNITIDKRPLDVLPFFS